MKGYTIEEIWDALIQRDLEMATQDLAYILKEGFVGYRKMRMTDLVGEFVCCNGMIDTKFTVLDELGNKFLVTVDEGGTPDIRVE